MWENMQEISNYLSESAIAFSGIFNDYPYNIILLLIMLLGIVFGIAHIVQEVKYRKSKECLR